MENYIGQVKPFLAGTNFDAYEDRVYEFMRANKIGNEQRTSVFISIMGDEVYDTLLSLTVPDEPTTKSLIELLDLLKNHYASCKSEQVEVCKFNKVFKQSESSQSQSQSKSSSNRSGSMSLGHYVNLSSGIRSFKTDDGLEEDLAVVNVVRQKNFQSGQIVDRDPLRCTLNVEGQDLELEVDSGASSTVMCQKEYEERFGHIKLSKVTEQFKVLTGDRIKTLGQAEVRVSVTGVIHLLSLVVVATNGYVQALLGRPWLDVLNPGWRNVLFCHESSTSMKINTVSTKTSPKFMETLKSKFPKLFVNNRNPIKGFKADLLVKEGAVPIFHAPYSVPFKLRERFEKELENQVADSVLEPVKFSRWAAPVVLVPKSDGGLRTCMDCKVTINKCIKTEHYPLPKIDDIFASLANCSYFCKIDLKGAYLQLEVSEESRELLTINTFKGLFRYNRMALGIKNGPSIFQSVMDQILSKLEKVFCYQDDILIGGTSLSDCQEKLFEVLRRLEDHNVQVNMNKSEFLVQSVEYLGHVVSTKGLSPNSNKVKAIKDAPNPENVSQLKAYLGLVNYYGKFMPNLSAELKDLYKLLRKGEKFVWSESCQKAFEKSKSMILDNCLLEMYDPDKPIILATDASPYGVGAVLSHMVDGVEKPVMFVSSSLSPAEKNYSQLHREALAIIFSLKKLHNYLYGQKFTIFTDNQALKEILSPDKNTPAVAAARLQRWAVILSMYDYEIVYRKGTCMGNADGLSRLPLKENTEIMSFRISYFNSDNSPINFEKIRSLTGKDEVLSKVRHHVMYGWPKNGEVCKSIEQYFHKRNSLSVENDCVFYGSRIVVPDEIKQGILGVLHENHLGIVRMKMVARSYVWWPFIDVDIESFCATCVTCQQTQRVKKEVVTTSWPTTSYPFERVHMDFFDFKGKKYFLLVDVFSKLSHIECMNGTHAEKVISVLQNFFIVFGLPTQLVSDNGPPFNSKKLRNFCVGLGIEFTNSPPYHPQSNGSAERYVGSVKNVFKKFLLGSDRTLSVQEKINKFLLLQRTTPSTVTKCAPLDLIFKYKPRTVLDSINYKVKVKVDSNQSRVESIAKSIRKQKEVKVNQDNLTKKVSFKVGDKVLYRNHFKNDVRWIPAKVVEVVSAHTYKIIVHSHIRFVHENQIKLSSLDDRYHPNMRVSPQMESKDFAQGEEPKPMQREVTFQVPVQEVQDRSRRRSKSLSEVETLRRSQRSRRKPVRFGMEV